MIFSNPMIVVTCDTQNERDVLMSLLKKLNISCCPWEKDKTDREGKTVTLFCLDCFIE